MPRHRWLDRNRLLVLALVALVVLSAFVLAEVLYTLVFAITVAYALLPPRRMLVDRGHSERTATAAVTTVATLGVVAIVSPAIYVLYRRRSSLFDLLQSVPAEIPIAFWGFSDTVETAPLISTAQNFLRDVALSMASASAVVSLKALLFAVVVYGLLLKPGRVRIVSLGLVPDDCHKVLLQYHERIHQTLVGIYLVQAATAIGTGAVAYVVFALLGYDAALTLAVLAGLLQFIPVIGPSVVVMGLAGLDLVGGNTSRAALVLVIGLFVIGFLPDAVLRPRFAGVAHLSTTLYFVGFVGGVLTLGPIGFVVGPLVVALLVETVSQLSAQHEDQAPTAAADTPAGPEMEG